VVGRRGDDRGPGVPGIKGFKDEAGNTLVTGGVRVGEAGQPEIVGVVATPWEDLLAVHP